MLSAGMKKIRQERGIGSGDGAAIILNRIARKDFLEWHLQRPQEVRKESKQTRIKNSRQKKGQLRRLWNSLAVVKILWTKGEQVREVMLAYDIKAWVLLKDVHFYSMTGIHLRLCSREVIWPSLGFY